MRRRARCLGNLCVAVLVSGISGCSVLFPVTVKVLPDKRGVPVKPAFTLSTASSQGPTNIGYDSVYVNATDVPYQGGETTVYSYYRFWPDGHVLRKNSVSYPTKEIAQDFSNGKVGYYQSDGQKLIIELFVPVHSAWHWDYVSEYFRIENDAIVLLHSEIRGEREPSAIRGIAYVKRDMGNLVGKPDW